MARTVKRGAAARAVTAGEILAGASQARPKGWGPLTGVRVLDMSRVLAGPFSTMLLADLGADVVKVEQPGIGDEARRFAPFKDGLSLYFACLNRGKRSLSLNLKADAGRRLFLSLVRQADILVENYRPGVMKRLRLDYPILRRLRPSLVYAACSGFGQTGPYRERRAYDMIVQGMGGIMSITGEPGRPPVRVGTSIGDITTALFTTIGILVALYHARATGRGQFVDVGMLDCQVAILEDAISRYMVSGRVPGPLGSRHPTLAPFEAFPTSDGYVVLAVGAQHWESFCRAIDRLDLATDARFASNALRVEHVDELRAILAPITARKPVAFWIQALEPLGVPCGPVNTLEKVVEDPQVKVREMLVDVLDPEVGPIRMTGLPIKLLATPGRIHGPAPRLGQHTEEVLAQWLGMQPDAVGRLREDGVV